MTYVADGEFGAIRDWSTLAAARAREADAEVARVALARSMQAAAARDAR